MHVCMYERESEDPRQGRRCGDGVSSMVSVGATSSSSYPLPLMDFPVPILHSKAEPSTP